MLASEVEWLSARHQQLELRTLTEQRRKAGSRVDNLLKVVEEKKHPLVADVRGETVARTESLTRALEHELGITEWSERHPEDPIGVTVREGPGSLRREACLPGAAGAGQRDEADVIPCEEREHLAELFLPAEELCLGDRQVRLVERLERRELVVSDLEDVLGRGEVLEAVLTEVTELVVDKALGRGGDEHLSAVAGGGDTGGAVDVVADVALVGQKRRSRVQADPYLHRTGGERLRRAGMRRTARRGGREREEEGVALGVDLDAALADAGITNHPTVLGKRHGVSLRPERVQELRRALDVGEEEGDSAAGKLRPHAEMMCRLV